MNNGYDNGQRDQNQNEKEESAINAQMYDATIKLLSQMKLLLGDITLSLNEYKSVFISGISSLELSIIPQYNDAVFIGDFKQTALAKAKHLFALGLTSDVPNVQKDVSLLSDDDIKALDELMGGESVETDDLLDSFQIEHEDGDDSLIADEDEDSMYGDVYEDESADDDYYGDDN